MERTVITGRVKDINRKKNIIFLVLENTRVVQIVVRKKSYKEFENLDICRGDIIKVTAEEDKKKEDSRYKVSLPSFVATDISILSKRINREKHIQCKKENLRKYSEVLLRIRNYLSKEGYFEVTLPVLTDGEISSKAHSYVTYPYRYKGKLFLRKTMDPFLRMLSCYDFEKVFSFGKCFRNEYITSTKQSEFEMLSIFSNYQKEEEAIKLALGIIEQIIPKSEVKVKYYDHSEYKRSREKLLIEVIKNFPNKKNSYASLKEDGTTREFKIKIKGITVVHGLMEIKNYEEYISKVKDQGKSENYGELEKLEKALQYGAPPCYNLGISITRIFMVYHNLSIKEIEPFPLSRLNMDQDG